MDPINPAGADEHTELDAPTSLDITAEISQLDVSIVAGRVAVLADASITGAEIEVTMLRGEPLQVVRRGRRLTIGYRRTSVLDMVRSDKKRRVELTVRVPATVEADVSTVSAEGLVAGLQSGATLNTVSGDLALHDVSGRIVTHSVSGRVEATGVAGDIDASSTSGDVTVSARRFDGLDVRNVSGDLTLDLADVPAGAGGRVRMHTVSGSATARIPAGAGYVVRAQTVSGTVVAGGQRLTRFGGASMRDGDGRFSFDVNSVSGDVTVLTAPEPAALSEPGRPALSASEGA